MKEENYVYGGASFLLVTTAVEVSLGVGCFGGVGIAEGGGIGGGIGFVRGMDGFALTTEFGMTGGLGFATSWVVVDFFITGYSLYSESPLGGFFLLGLSFTGFSFGGSEHGMVAIEGSGGGRLAFSGMEGGIEAAVDCGGGGSGGRNGGGACASVGLGVGSVERDSLLEMKEKRLDLRFGRVVLVHVSNHPHAYLIGGC